MTTSKNKHPRALRQTGAALLLAIVFVILEPASAQSQWVTNGANINNTNAGAVGIGTSSPRAKLEINGGMLNTAALNANSNLVNYDVGVGSVGAQTLYGYNAICIGKL